MRGDAGNAAAGPEIEHAPPANARLMCENMGRQRQSARPWKAPIGRARIMPIRKRGQPAAGVGKPERHTAKLRKMPGPQPFAQFAFDPSGHQRTNPQGNDRPGSGLVGGDGLEPPTSTV